MSTPPPYDGFLPAGVDKNGNFAPRILTRLRALFSVRTPRRMPKGDRFGQLGDSTIAGGDGLSTAFFRQTIGHQLALLSGGRLSLVRNAGVAGNTLQQMIDRFATDVIPYKLDVLLIRGGVNDEFAGASFEQFQQRITTLVQLCIDNDIVPIFDTISPVDYATASAVTRYKQWNAWLRTYCQSMGIRCADSWAAATAGTRSGSKWPEGSYTTDGLHPTQRGAMVIVRALLVVIQDLPVAPPTYALAAAVSTDYGPANNLFLTNASGKVTTGWTWETSGSPNPTYAMVDVPGIPGKVQQITISETGSKSVSFKSADVVVDSSVFSAGDRIRVSALCSVRLTNVNEGQTVALGMGPLQFSWGEGAKDYLAEIIVGHAGPGTTEYAYLYENFFVLSCEFIARASDVAWLVKFTAATGAGSGAAGGAAVVRVAAPQFVNLTRAGLA